MVFRPKVNSDITINRETFYFTEHPSAPGIPYGQSGKRATVYQIQRPGGACFALKVFIATFRKAEIEESAKALSSYATLSGLQVCKRDVLNANNNSQLIQVYPELTYAVLMPWVNGRTWFDVLAGRQAFNKGQSNTVARAFLNVLNEMEQRGLAHCDLSSPNVIVNDFVTEGFPQVALVDVEDMFGPGFRRPSILPGGASGYAHQTSKSGQWNPVADRFAGAVIVSEMLAWFDANVRNAAEGEQFFTQSEMQTNSPRADLLHQTLKDNWGEDVAILFRKAWESQSLSDCPTFSEWLDAVKSSEHRAVVTFRSLASSRATPQPAPEPVHPVQGGTTRKLIVATDLEGLQSQAQQFEATGEFQSALDVYKTLHRKSNDSQFQEKIQQLENMLKTKPKAPGNVSTTPAYSNPASVTPAIETPSYRSYNGQKTGRETDRAPKKSNRALVWVGLGIGALLIFVMSGVALAGGWLMFGPPVVTVVPSDPPVPAPVNDVPSASQTSVPTSTKQRNTATPRPSNTAFIDSQYVKIAVEYIYLRKGPHITHPYAIDVLYSSGTDLQILGYYETWFYVEAPNGTRGWAYEGWLDTSHLNLDAIETVSNAPTIPPTVKPTHSKKDRYP